MEPWEIFEENTHLRKKISSMERDMQSYKNEVAIYQRRDQAREDMIAVCQQRIRDCEAEAALVRKLFNSTGLKPVHKVVLYILRDMMQIKHVSQLILTDAIKEHIAGITDLKTRKLDDVLRELEEQGMIGKKIEYGSSVSRGGSRDMQTIITWVSNSFGENGFRYP